jgi:hypothetical protein
MARRPPAAIEGVVRCVLACSDVGAPHPLGGHTRDPTLSLSGSAINRGNPGPPPPADSLNLIAIDDTTCLQVRLDEWLKKFSALHERARAGNMNLVETRTYLGARNELARAILKQQQKKVPANAKTRQLLRVAAALPVDVHVSGGVVHALTQELWTGGFTAIVPPLGTPTERVRFALTLSKEGPPLEGSARVISDSAVGGSTRLTVEFEGMAPADAERVEFAVFDALLVRFAVPGTPG